MTSYSIYVCEVCGFESKDVEEVKLCEAKHLGLETAEDLYRYQLLKEDVAFLASTLMINNNEINDKKHSQAIERLQKFEKMMNIKYPLSIKDEFKGL